MAEVAIRQLEARDETEWRRLWTAYLEFYKSTVPKEVYRSTFARILAGNAGETNQLYGLVAETGGRPVGIAHYLFHRHCWKLDDVCYFQDLYVEPELRGKRLGRALIEAVYAKADEAGCPAVYWMTQDNNHTARRLYDRLAKLTPFVKYSRF